MKNKTTVSNIIELIEQLATQSSLQGSSAQTNAIKKADISAELQESLIKQDIKILESQLNLDNRIRCVGVYPGESDEEKREEEQDQSDETQNLKFIAL
jgi:hypothetical protein